ncbi:MAG: hypothetical protein WCK63_18920, partial [Betaproteobacteria bacterium]
PWIDCGVEFKFFRFASTRTVSKAAGLTTSKVHELVWDLEKLIHYTKPGQDGKPLIKEAWVAIFEEVGSESKLPGIYDKSKVDFNKIKISLKNEPREESKKILLDKIEQIFSTDPLKEVLINQMWIITKIDNINVGYCWRKAERPACIAKST